MTDETKTESTDLLPVDRRPPPAPSSLPTLGTSGFLPTEEELRAAQRYANGLVMAGIVPDAFKFNKDVLGPPGSDGPIHRKGDINNPLVLMGVLKCIEIGVAPQTGLAGLLPLNGRFAVWGDLAAGLVQRGGQVANHQKFQLGGTLQPGTPLGEWPDDYGYEVKYWRRGQEAPYVGRFTVADAKRAQLWMNSNKEPWSKYPDRMLFNRARAFALRDGFADALMGLSIAEEVMDMQPPPEEVKRIEIKRLAALTDDEPEVIEAKPSESAQDAPDEPEATSDSQDTEIAPDEPERPAGDDIEGDKLI